MGIAALYLNQTAPHRSLVSHCSYCPLMHQAWLLPCLLRFGLIIPQRHLRLFLLAVFAARSVARLVLPTLAMLIVAVYQLIFASIPASVFQVRALRVCRHARKLTNVCCAGLYKYTHTYRYSYAYTYVYLHASMEGGRPKVSGLRNRRVLVLLLFLLHFCRGRPIAAASGRDCLHCGRSSLYV